MEMADWRFRALPMALLAAVFALAGSSCREKDKVGVASGLRTDTMPTMSTVNVSTLISDSGVTQYKIVAPLWKVYDEATDPYWIFPHGIYLQKYDPKMRVIATIAADSAKYFKNRGLWRLDGHVEVRKKPKDLFLTQQVYWNQKRRQVYSDSFIHIENETHVLEGYGFTASEDFTDYSITNPQGIFPAERKDIAPAAASPSSPAGISGAPSPSSPSSPAR